MDERLAFDAESLCMFELFSSVKNLSLILARAVILDVHLLILGESRHQTWRHATFLYETLIIWFWNDQWLFLICGFVIIMTLEWDTRDQLFCIIEFCLNLLLGSYVHVVISIHLIVFIQPQRLRWFRHLTHVEILSMHHLAGNLSGSYIFIFVFSSH